MTPLIRELWVFGNSELYRYLFLFIKSHQLTLICAQSTVRILLAYLFWTSFCHSSSEILIEDSPDDSAVDSAPCVCVATRS